MLQREAALPLLRPPFTWVAPARDSGRYPEHSEAMNPQLLIHSTPIFLLLLILIVITILFTINIISHLL